MKPASVACWTWAPADAPPPQLSETAPLTPVAVRPDGAAGLSPMEKISLVRRAVPFAARTRYQIGLVV